MNVILIGRNEVLYDTAVMLSKKHKICGIISAVASPEYLKNESDFLKLSKKLKCPFFLAKTINQDAIQFIKKCKPDIGISVNWVSVIGDNVIKEIPYGILNSHPSLLPKYKGNAATSWALLMNEKKIGVTIHFMKAGELDSGDILCQEKYKIQESSTIKELNQFWQEVTPKLFSKAIEGLKNKTIVPKKQNNNGFRAYPRLPIDSKIDWAKPAKEINTLIRASTKPYMGAYTYLKIEGLIKKVIVWESRVVSAKTKDIGTPGHIIYNNKQNGETHIYTGNGILGLLKVEYENEREFLPGKEWKSIRLRFGIDIEQEIILIQKQLLGK